ncbi:MAG: hypothetical protein FWC26_11605 [Fibromonadales bacterium]|nr:hypothetical protein [Fibromonadales bacterium]
MPNFAKTEKTCAVFSMIFLCIGMVFRTIIYAKGQDLWLEEALLWERLKPLIGGYDISELALRFLPLLAGIATLLLAYIFAKNEFGGKFACIFLFLLVSSDSLLFYSVNFSLYGMEAFLIVLCLCVWSFSHKSKTDLILLISLSSILCIICNHGESYVYSPSFDFFIQMLGRHFINFHYFVFGPFVWINAFLFILLFGFGCFLLGKEKKILMVAISIPFFILILLYFLKLSPLGMPYSDFMFTMRNWSQMQVIGSKYLVFIMPLVFIPAALCVHKVFSRVGNPVLIGILVIFTFLALSSNAIRMHKGIGSPQSTEILLQINDRATEKSLVYADSASRPLFEYYMSRSPFKDNENLNVLYLKKDGYMYLNDSVFIGRYNMRPEDIFGVMRNFKAQSGFFFFSFGGYSSVKESNMIVNHIQNNHTGRSKGFQSKNAGAAWVRF